MTQVDRLKAEYVTLSQESLELIQEKSELREDQTSLRSDIEILNAQYQHRVRTMVPWIPHYTYTVPVVGVSTLPFPLNGTQNPAASLSPKTEEQDDVGLELELKIHASSSVQQDVSGKEKTTTAPGSSNSYSSSEAVQDSSPEKKISSFLVLDKEVGSTWFGDTSMAPHDSLPREVLEMESSQLHVDYELGVLLDRVKSAASLRSKAGILAVPALAHLSEQLEVEDDGSVSQVAKDINLLSFHNPGEDKFTGTSKNQDSLVIEDGVYTQSIQMVADVLESLLRRVTAAESETSIQKERVSIGEEEIRRKTVEIETLSLRLEEMKRIVLGNKALLDETTEVIKKLVEDSRRDREKAVENEEELRRVKAECESLRNYVNTSTNVIQTLLSSEQQFQTDEARLVNKLAELEGEKAQKKVEVQKLMEENVKLAALLDKKEAQLMALNEQCKVMALNASNI